MSITDTFAVITSSSLRFNFLRKSYIERLRFSLSWFTHLINCLARLNLLFNKVLVRLSHQPWLLLLLPFFILFYSCKLNLQLKWLAHKSHFYNAGGRCRRHHHHHLWSCQWAALINSWWRKIKKREDGSLLEYCISLWLRFSYWYFGKIPLRFYYSLNSQFILKYSGSVSFLTRSFGCLGGKVLCGFDWNFNLLN